MEAYPEPRIPKHSVLSLATFGSRRRAPYPSVLDCGKGKLVTSGRMAIALALQHMGAGRHDKILIPAYHCNSMVEPVLWVGASPVYYRIHEDTRVDLDDIRAKLDRSVKALMITHYFGFPQDTPKVRALCDEAGIALIEDCAHAFFGIFAGRPPGWYGDYAIASAMKFFPVYDGGCLVSSRRDVTDIRTSPTGFAFQLKASINTFEQAFRYERLSALRILLQLPIWLKDALWGAAKSLAPLRAGANMAPAASSGGYEFDAAWIDKRMSLVSRLIMRLASRDRIVERRRHNYEQLLQGLSDLPGVRPLFPTLPEGVAPYMFPLLVDEPERVVPELRRLGVPIMRWETLAAGVDASMFAVSHNYSLRLLQFPCHDEITSAELEWMIAQIRSILTSHRSAGSATRARLENAYEMEDSPRR